MRLLLVAVFLASLCPRAEAWGFAVHRAIHRSAVTLLPEPLASLFRGNVEFLVEHSVDPDLWRAEGRPGEDVAHFLELDVLGRPPFTEVPRDEARARRRGRGREPGRLPWRTAEVYRELVEAYRARDPARVLERAATLGHYVADAQVPFHATSNHDGQRTGQDGIHSRWETGLFDRYRRRLTARLDPSMPQPSVDPIGVSFESLIESFSAVAPILESDRIAAAGCSHARRTSGACYDDSYFETLYAREGQRVRARLRSAASRVASLWLGAWAEAGRPAVDTGFRLPRRRRPKGSGPAGPRIPGRALPED
jgi:hypothetical protein